MNCRIKGKFRLAGEKTTNPVVVGDKVEVDLEKDGNGIISEIMPRQNYVLRQAPDRKNIRHIVAANVDQALLIVTLTKPKTSLGFVDRFLAHAEAFGIPVKLIVNKMDLHNEEETGIVKLLAKIYDPLGYQTLAISATKEKNLAKIRKLLKGKVSLLAGYSGAGKSTLINKLHPDLDLKTDEISRKTKKGRHVTTFVEMFELPFGGYAIDSPGMKEFKITDLTPEQIRGCFPEFAEHVPNCQFQDCFHNEEPNCGVKDALQEGLIHPSRYAHYLDILDAMQKVKPWE